MIQTRWRLLRSCAALAAVLVFTAGCNESIAPVPLGRIIARVATANDVGVSGVPVDLLLPNRTVWRAALTGADGTAEFGASDGGVIPRDYLVRVLLSGTQYVLSSGETNDKPVTVTVDVTSTVTFRVVRNVPTF